MTTSSTSPKNNKVVAWIVGILLFAALCGAGWYFFLRKKKDDTNPLDRSEPTPAADPSYAPPKGAEGGGDKTPKPMIPAGYRKTKDVSEALIVGAVGLDPIVPQAFDINKKLSTGMKGFDVKVLQLLLNYLGAGLTADGVFGAKTFKAVSTYLKVSGASLSEAHKIVRQTKP